MTFLVVWIRVGFRMERERAARLEANARAEAEQLRQRAIMHGQATYGRDDQGLPQFMFLGETKEWVDPYD